MQWSEVFDKYFIIDGMQNSVVVFIPGTLTDSNIKWAWVSKDAINDPIDYSLLYQTTYACYGSEKDGPGYQFQKWRPLKVLSQEERVCNKIKVMEERWNRFQELKKKPPVIIHHATLTTGFSIDYGTTATVCDSW